MANGYLTHLLFDGFKIIIPENQMCVCMCIYYEKTKCECVGCLQELSLKEKQLFVTHTPSVHGGRAGTSCHFPGRRTAMLRGLHETCCPSMQGGTNTADSL